MWIFKLSRVGKIKYIGNRCTFLYGSFLCIFNFFLLDFAKKLFYNFTTKIDFCGNYDSNAIVYIYYTGELKVFMFTEKTIQYIVNMLFCTIQHLVHKTEFLTL